MLILFLKNNAIEMPGKPQESEIEFMTLQTSSLVHWGWRDFFSQQISDTPAENIARVLKEQRDHYQLVNGHGNVVGGVIPGKWKKRKDDFENPSVGDWVTLSEKTNTKAGIPYYLIEKRLNRFSQILRKAAGPSEKSQLLATNVDVAFIVSSCNQDFDVKRVERYIALLNEGTIKPILILNKCDLPSFADCNEKLVARFPNFPIIKTRADQAASINEISRILGSGITSVFLGSSGVGKSTLTNFLLGETKQTVQEIRNNDSKGRHTTTGRSMFLLPDNLGLIIDTPGLREVQLPGQDNNLEEAFADLAELSLTCRFPDCKHLTEPSCAVKEAVSKGTLSQDRLAHFQKLKAEVDEKKSYKRKK